MVREVVGARGASLGGPYGRTYGACRQGAGTHCCVAVDESRGSLAARCVSFCQIVWSRHSSVFHSFLPSVCLCKFSVTRKCRDVVSHVPAQSGDVVPRECAERMHQYRLNRHARQKWRPRWVRAHRSTATPTPRRWRHAGHVRARQSEKAVLALCGVWCGRAAVGRRRLRSSWLTCLRCARAPTLHRSSRTSSANWTLPPGSRRSKASRACLRPLWSPVVLLCTLPASTPNSC